MADTQFDRISSLSTRLAGLGNKSRGMPIEADDWNGIVAVLQGLLEIDRTQQDQQGAALAQSFAPREHEHLGQVTMAWLDADLQTRIGASSSPTSLLQRVAQLETQLAGINHELARVSDLTDAHQTSIDRFGVNDLNRANAIRGFDEKLGTVTGIQTTVAAVTSDLASVKSNIETVLQLRNTLAGPDGTPLDVAGMKQDITGLQQLRDNLKGIDGGVVRIADIELRLKGVEDASGVGVAGGLDARINAAVGSVETRLKSDQATRFTALRDQLTTESLQRNAVFQADVQKGVDVKLAAASDAGKALTDLATTQLRSETADRLASAIATAKQEQTDTTREFVGQRLAAVPGQISTAIAGARPEILKAAQDAAAAQAAAVLQTALPTAEQRINTRLDSAIALVQQNQAASENRLQTGFNVSVGKLRDELTGTIVARFDVFDTTFPTLVSTQVSTAMNAALPGITTATQAAIDQRFANVDTRVSQAVADATKTLPDTIASQVSLQLAQVNVTGQIGAATTQLTQQLRTELATAVSAQQDRSTAALSAVVTQLRGETAAAVKAGTDDVFTRTGVLVGSVRSELATTANSLRTELTGTIVRENQKLSTDFSGRLSQVSLGTVIRPLNP